MRLILAIFVSITLSGCGSFSKDDSSNEGDSTSNNRTGIYHTGDQVKFKITRKGYETPEYFQSGKVTSVDGSKVEITWEDHYDEEGLNLVDWEENPYVDQFDYNNATINRKARTYAYEDDKAMTIKSPAGDFPCIMRTIMVTEATETGTKYNKTERCDTEAVAVAGYAYLKRTYLDEEGKELRHFEKTLLLNKKN
jgi:hypothetical protein